MVQRTFLAAAGQGTGEDDEGQGQGRGVGGSASTTVGGSVDRTPPATLADLLTAVLEDRR